MDYSAIGGVYGSLASALIGYQANEKTNQTNIAINRSTQDYQAAENQKQRDFTREQWEREMEYNTPAAQMQRYRDAGLNPYISDTAIGSGETKAPSAPPSVSAPTPLAAHAYNPPDFGQVFVNQRLAASQSANQQAQSLLTYAEAGKVLTELYGADKAGEILAPFIKGTLGASIDTNTFAQSIKAKAEKEEADANLKNFELDLQKEFGREKAQRDIWKLDYEYSESVARVGLWHTLSELNKSNIQLNEKEFEVKQAQIRELLSRVIDNLSSANLKNQLGLTEAQLRRWTVLKVKSDAAIRSYEEGESAADYIWNAPVRRTKMSHSGQFARSYDFNLQVNPFFNTLDRVSGVLSGALRSIEPALPKVETVTRSGMYRRHVNSMSPTGYKMFEEWSSPY